MAEVAQRAKDARAAWGANVSRWDLCRLRENRSQPSREFEQHFVHEAVLACLRPELRH